MVTRPELLVLTGDLKGKRFTVNERALRLGRSSSNDIHIPDEGLSRNHCLFDAVGASGLRVIDLCSANGTFVNDESIGKDSVTLNVGDVVQVGETKIKIIGEGSVADIDLGLGEATTESAEEKSRPERTSPIKIVCLASVLVLLGVVAALVFAPQAISDQERSPDGAAARDSAEAQAEAPTVREFVYEKVKADENGIFRYYLTASFDGEMKLKIDDTAQNRHVPAETKKLTSASREELDRVLEYALVSRLDSSYSGSRAKPFAAETTTLKVVYSIGVKSVKIMNAEEPEAFAELRTRLEAFANGEFGVWAMAYSLGEMLAKAENAVRLGDIKWQERDVDHGNLSAAIAAYDEAEFYLKTVEPKPSCHAVAVEGLDRARKELESRCRHQRFLIERAMKLSQWESARDGLKVLMEMVPNPKDDCHRNARETLLRVEDNIRKGGR